MARCRSRGRYGARGAGEDKEVPPADETGHRAAEGDSLAHDRPHLVLLGGDALAARHAAWALIAEAAERALDVPDLCPVEHARFDRLLAAARRAADLPLLRSPRLRQRGPVLAIHALLTFLA